MIENPLRLAVQYDHPDDINPLHAPTSTLLVEELVADMEERGWHGPPLIVDSRHCQAWTGSHRHVAATEAGIDIPWIDLADFLAACGYDLATVEADASIEPRYDWNGNDRRTYDAILECSEMISTEILATYGLDLH